MGRYRLHHSLGRRVVIRQLFRWAKKHFGDIKSCKHQKLTAAQLVALLPPELQPAERLWQWTDQPLKNRYFESLPALQKVLEKQCAWLGNQREKVKGLTGFHWWPFITSSARRYLTAQESGNLRYAYQIASASTP